MLNGGWTSAYERTGDRQLEAWCTDLEVIKGVPSTDQVALLNPEEYPSRFYDDDSLLLS